MLNKFYIPYVAVYDKDHQERKNSEARNVADRASRKIEDSIRDIGKSIILVNDIEEELGMLAGTSNKPYEALKKISQDSFEVKSSFDKKLREIYL